MYRPSNRSLPCALAAIFVAAMLTAATVGPAYAGPGDAKRCGETAAKPSRMIRA